MVLAAVGRWLLEQRHVERQHRARLDERALLQPSQPPSHRLAGRLLALWRRRERAPRGEAKGDAYQRARE